MKQKTLIAALMAGMLVLAGCGGGSSGISERDAEDRAKKAVEDALAGITPCEGDAVMVDDDGKCVLNPDHMSPADAAAMAMKLWAGIGTAPLDNNGSGTDTADGDGDLSVQWQTNDAVELAKTEAMVGELHGWEGSEHSGKPASDDTEGGSYTARLYSNVGEPAEGAVFNELDGFADGVLPDGTVDNAANAANVALDGYSRSAGAQTFKLPDPNPNGQTVITLPGAYGGVRGTYSCNPADDANGCTATLSAGGGLTLSDGDAWTFRPGNPEARIMGAEDAVYVSYGWWLHEADNGDATVGVFTATRGTPVAADGITALRGTATYTGGAAGKYAVRSGSTSDSGHFVADAELKANFNTDMVSGTIGNFRVGDDGESRDWSVKLEEATVTNAGAISGGDTEWTMGGTAADAGGTWSGTLYHDTAGGDGGVPKTGTGRFHSEYDNIGRMVGAFGVNLDE